MSKKKILIIDDDSVIRNALFEFFSDKGFAVALAADGKEGLEQFKKESPDLIVLDLIMPVMSGVEFLEKVREENSSVSVVVLTGYGTEDQINRLNELGVSSIIRKGIGFEDFLAQIEEVLDRKEHQVSLLHIDPASVKILVADDDNVIRTLLVEFLVEKGFQVMNAKNGQEACDVILQHHPEIVFLDLIMPIKDGKAVLEAIPESLARDTKWVVITGHREKLKDLANIGKKYQVLHKPFSLDSFEDTVVNLLKEYSIKI